LVTKVAILGGTGALGVGLAIRLSKAGHEVLIGSRSREKAQAFVSEMKAAHPGFHGWGGELAETAAAADLSILSVPYAAHAETLAQVRSQLAGKILIDTTAPVRPPKVGTVQLPEAGSAAVEAQRALGPEARVVSALQTVSAGKLASGKAIDGDVLVAADDAEAATVVCELLSGMGLRAWHVGPLANSAAAEAMTSVLIQINRRYKRVQSGLRITGMPRETAEQTGPRRSDGVSIQPLRGLPLFAAGDDLAAELGDAIIRNGVAPEDGDVIVVAQKIVSKVEGRAAPLDGIATTAESEALAHQTGKPAALIELIQAESQEIMRVRNGLIITRHRTGHVAANAGIDFSNVVDPAEPPTALLWPVDPDASAARLRAALQERFGVSLAVIISDSLGRAWRIGTAGTAIGVAGLKPLRDRRGETDLFGRVLQATIVAVADEIASAASLVIGEAAEATPAALVRGVVFEADDDAGIGELLRPIEQDLFR
jgi:coenzyme F420-0:L-glutamate ligase / coenzyme F420-1:gamma-L-glutamate ligase